MSSASVSSYSFAPNSAVVSKYSDNYSESVDVIYTPSKPSIGADEVLVKVYAASVNPIDWKLLKGWGKLYFKLIFPFTPGFDCSGEVVEVGSNCRRLKVGDKVYADLGKPATYTEYVAIPERLAGVIPRGLSYVEAGAIPLVGLTSYQALFQHAKITAKDRVLVLGGSSGCGHLAVQFAKAIGCYVATTVSEKNHALFQELPNRPDLLIDYQKSNWSEVLKNAGITVIYECVSDPANSQFIKAAAVLQPSGKFVTIVSRQPPADKAFQYILVNCDTSGEQYKQLEDIANYFNEKKVQVWVDKVFPFTKQGIVDLLNHSEAGRARGKLVLEVQKSNESIKTLSK